MRPSASSSRPSHRGQLAGPSLCPGVDVRRGCVAVCGLPRAYGASFTMADAMTLPFFVPINRNLTRGYATHCTLTQVNKTVESLVFRLAGWMSRVVRIG